MAKDSFDLPLQQPEDRDSPPRAVVLKAILPDDPSESSHELDPLDEIRALAATAGVEIVGAVTQRRRLVHGSTYVGKGKLEELQELAEATGASVVIVDDAISPSQGRNIEERTEIRVIDRAELIMDIFATHARTHQAKLQVEMAQLRYSQTRLKRMWTHLSRFEGGIGMRGPGETQLETDRRIIRKKIGLLKSKLKEIEQQVSTQHKSRESAFKIALVGYTNAGKSSLMRVLTGAPVLVEDQLFSTLDTSTRKWELPCAPEVILSDTVGFIRKLPRGLVASFHATLMEAEEADLLLHVVDGSTSHVEADIEAVNSTLKSIGCQDQKCLLVFNKMDLLPPERQIDMQHLLASHPNSLAVSAKDGRGIEAELVKRVLQIITESEAVQEYTIPIGRGDLLARLRELGTIEDEVYENDRVEVRVRLRPEDQRRFEVLLDRNGIRRGRTTEEVR